MLFFKKIRFIFNIILLSGVFFIVGFSLFKILSNKKNISQQKIPKDYSNLTIHWEKNNYIIPVDKLSLSDSIYVGNYYYLIQSIDSNNSAEKCLLGSLKLQSIKKDRYIFFSEKALNKSKLSQYSQFSSFDMVVIPLENKEYLKKGHITQCQNWIKLVNNEKAENLEKNNILPLNKKYLNVVVNKCLTLPNKKYLKIESTNPAHLSLEYDEIYNRVSLCAKSLGQSLLIFQPIDGAAQFAIQSKAIQSSSALKTVIHKNQIKNPHDEVFLLKKTLPGW